MGAAGPGNRPQDDDQWAASGPPFLRLDKDKEVE